MNTPPKGKRRDSIPELAKKYAQKKKPTKAQRKLARRQADFDEVMARQDGHNGYHFIKPGSNK